ncbi:MAG: hypothetical protein M1829_001610 [Trizodia sp. TS-e1964]|nr:MAG: hypothetical protein M1829_001610 [Trizodia sp. TS-e1964]
MHLTLLSTFCLMLQMLFRIAAATPYPTQLQSSSRLSVRSSSPHIEPSEPLGISKTFIGTMNKDQLQQLLADLSNAKVLDLGLPLYISPLYPPDVARVYQDLWDAIFAARLEFQNNPQELLSPNAVLSIFGLLSEWRSVVMKLENTMPSIAAMKAFFDGLNPDRYPAAGGRVEPWDFLDG